MLYITIFAFHNKKMQKRKKGQRTAEFVSDNQILIACEYVFIQSNNYAQTTVDNSTVEILNDKFLREFYNKET